MCQVNIEEKNNNELYREYIETNELNDVKDISTYLLSFIIIIAKLIEEMKWNYKSVKGHMYSEISYERVTVDGQKQKFILEIK